MSRFEQLSRECCKMDLGDQARVLCRFTAKLDHLDGQIESVYMVELADRLERAVAEVKEKEVQAA